jgi:hypothetical protein
MTGDPEGGPGERGRARTLVRAAGAALLLAAAACAERSDMAGPTTERLSMAVRGYATTEPMSTLESVADTVDDPHVDVRDGGRTLLVDGDGDHRSPGASLTTIASVLRELDTPDAVVARMEQTRALDGMQTGEWDTLSMTWTYHLDAGLDLIIEELG